MANLSKNALTVLEKRYLLKDEEPEDMFRRVANAVAKGEKQCLKGYSFSSKEAHANYLKYRQEFYIMMSELKFLPNSPTLMNAGKKDAQLSACFVLPIEDSMGSIFETIKNTALIHQSGGGTGFSFSKLRPEGSVVKSSGGIASGPVSFMRVFNAATEAVKQGGTRRGANMGILRCDHADIEKFIKCKEIEGDFANFNISVALTNEFMENVKNFWPSPPGRVSQATRNCSIFDLIVDKAWSNGEPGVIFIDEINRHNPTLEIGEVIATNPCGEVPLLNYESCVLGSINLAKHVMSQNGKFLVDWIELTKTVKLAVRFLDNVIEVNHFPLPEIAEMSKVNRKIGLGVMGWADMLVQLGIQYDSVEGVELARNVMNHINCSATLESEQLAIERGAFPNFDESIYRGKRFRRNATCTTIAPTGSISIVADCSSGIEPYFALAYKKNVADTVLVERNKYLKNVLPIEGNLTGWLWKYIDEHGCFPNGHRYEERKWSNCSDIFRTANEISPEWHVKMQAAFQKYTDNAVSKTINMPNSATKSDVKDAFLLAYKLKCKGLTIYRNGSRMKQPLIKGDKDEKFSMDVVSVDTNNSSLNSSVDEAREVRLGSSVNTIGIFHKSKSTGLDEELIRLDDKELSKRFLERDSEAIYEYEMKNSEEIQKGGENVEKAESSNNTNSVMGNNASVDSNKESEFRDVVHSSGDGDNVSIRDGVKGEQRNEGLSDSGSSNDRVSINDLGTGGGNGYNTRSHTVIDEKRPKTVKGRTTKEVTGCGALYVTVNYGLDGKPFEMFCNMGKFGMCEGASNEAIGRLVSLCLKNGVDIPSIVKQLTGIRCNNQIGLGSNKILSCADAVATILTGMDKMFCDCKKLGVAGELIRKGDLVFVGEVEQKPQGCPDCGNEMISAENCLSCRACGYSKCS